MPGNLERRIRRAEEARAMTAQQTMAARRAQYERERAYLDAHPDIDRELHGLALAYIFALSNGRQEEAAAAGARFMACRDKLEQALAEWPA